MKKLLNILFAFFLMPGFAYGQTEKTLQPISVVTPTTNNSTVSGQTSIVQDANNTAYNTDQSTKEAYQKKQVQSIQQLTSAPASAAEKIPTTNQATNLIPAPSQITGQPLQTITQQDILSQNQTIPGTAITHTSPSLANRKTGNEDLPLFQITRPEQRIREKRVDLRNLSPNVLWQKQILDNAKAVAIVIEKNKIHAITDSIYQLDVVLTLGQQFKLCPGTPFLDQPVIGIGTAFIINERTMVTANHVFLEDLDRYAIVFGFEMVNKTGAYEGLISLKDIYFPTRIIQNSEVLDIVAFEVSRPLERSALKCSLSRLPPLNSSIYMIGHPYGLPKKVALNAEIRSAGQEEYFYTSLFASQGNSGSPVFELATNRVIGILVSGEIDYTWNGNCNSSVVCGIPYCNGEKVISITALPQIQDLLELKSD